MKINSQNLTFQNTSFSNKMNSNSRFARAMGFSKILKSFLVLGILLSCVQVNAQLVTIGTETNVNTGSTYPAPYGNYYWGAKHHILIKSSELIAAGASAGFIASIAFDVTTAEGEPLTDFAMKIKHTSATFLNNTFDGVGFTNVYGPQSYTETTGWNTHALSSPFNWDGTSNLLIEVCFNNTGYTNNALTRYSTTSFVSCSYYRFDGAGACANPTAISSTANRPNMQFLFATTPDDIGITAFTSPVTGTGLIASETVTVNVLNSGIDPQDSILLFYRIDGGTPIADTLFPSLVGGTSTNFSFAVNADLSAYTTYAFDAWTSLVADTSNSNDTVSGYLVTNIQPVNDVGVTGFTAPISNVTLGSTETVTIEITNYGDFIEDSIPVAYRIDGGAPIIDTLFPPINPGDTVSLSFAGTADLSIDGSYIFDAWTALSGDNDNTNDSLMNHIVSNDFDFPDVGAVGIFSPKSGFNLSNSETVTVFIRNHGNIAVANIPVSYTLNGGVPILDTLIDSINPGGTKSVTFPIPVDLSTTGSFNFKAWTTLINDSLIANDTILNIINHYPNPITTTILRAYGKGLDDIAEDARITSDGGTIIIGKTRASLQQEIAVVRTNFRGDTLWAKKYGDSLSNDYGTSIRQTRDGGFILLGYTYGFGVDQVDIYLTKIDSSGNIIWSKTHGWIGYEEGQSIQQTADGGYIITGWSFSLGFGSTDIFLMKTDSNGDLLWTKSYGESGGDEMNCVRQTNDGGYIMTGYTGSFGVGGWDVLLIKTDAVGDTLWTKTYGGTSPDIANSVKQTNDGGYIISGISYSFGPGYMAYLIKTDNSGDTLWTKAFSVGNNSQDEAYSVVQTNDGFAISGETFISGFSDDAFLLKTDTNGDELWTYTYGRSSGDDQVFSLQETGDGGYLMAGFTDDIGAGADDFLLIKTDSTGATNSCHERLVTTTTFSTATIQGGTTISVGSTTPSSTTAATVVTDYLPIVTDHRIAFDISGSDPLCTNASNGTVEITSASGLLGVTTISWSTGYSGGTEATNISNLIQGTYSVSVTSDNGNCITTDSVALVDPPLFTSSITHTDVSCYFGGDGTATVMPLGGIPPYNYNWVNGQTDSTAIGLFAGSYAVNVFDLYGCIANNLVEISQPDALATTVTSTSVTCIGGSDGATDLVINGGTPPYTYSWSNGDTIEDLSGLSIGTYAVTLTDSCGAVLNDSIIVSGPSALISTIIATSVSCKGNLNGEVDLSVSGGKFPYTYSWDDPGASTTEDLSGLDSGFYIVNISDACGILTADSVLINEPNLLTSTITGTNATCNGGGDGTATLTVVGGTPPYNYNWVNGQTTSAAIGLFPGNYGVNVFDINGCLASNNISITQPNSMTASLSASDASCYTGNDGSVTITKNGGTSPYTYLWSNSASTQNLTSVIAGMYSVTITDSCGAVIIDSIAVNEPAPVTSTISKVDVSCNGYDDGSAILTAAGGTPPYTYTWSTGATVPGISGLPDSTYSVIVSDACAITIYDTVVIAEPAVMTTIMSKSDVTCNGGGNGTATVSVSGGTGPYNYLWNIGQTDSTAIGLFPNNYTVNITDLNGCLASDIVTITEPAALSGSASGTDATCIVGNDGTTTIVFAGGTAPYTYLWSPSGATTPTATNLTQGTHTITLTDSCGATLIDSAFVGGPGSLNAVISGTNVSCNGYTDGAVDILVSYGTPPYSYLWSTSATTEDISGLIIGTYSVTVTDSCGTSVIDSIVITEPTLLNTTISATDVNCHGTGDGTALVVPTGGTAPYFYLWNNGQANAAMIGLFPATYTVNVTDVNGCLKSDIITITQPAALSVNMSSTNASCSIGNDGTATANISGGTGPYSYIWFPSGDTVASATNLTQGTYTVTVTDSCGASWIDSVNVGGPGSLSASISGTDVSCNGFADGSIDLQILSGIPPYSYQWSNGDSTEDVSGLSIGAYGVTITDSCGTVISDSLTIGEPLLLSTIISGFNVSCNGLGDGTATITPSGGTPPYYYLWNNNQSLANILGLFPGSYAVNVTDNNGCLASNSITISQPTDIVISISVVDASCGEADGAATAVVSGGASPYAYSWSSGGTAPSDTSLTGGNYTLLVTDTNGCTDSSSVLIPITSPVQEICLITVDSTSTKNVVVWEKPVATNIDSFRIYRDIVGTYTLVGSQPYGVESYFTDTTNNVNPKATSYRYKVATLDVCGNESVMGNYHETIHVQTTDNGSTVDLLWDNYEGFNFGFYRILRDSTGLGGTNWQALDSVTNANFTFTDLNPPSIGAAYIVEVVPNAICEAKKQKNFNSSKSNTSTSVGVVSNLTGTISATDASAGGCDGSATVTVTGGTPPFTYAWDGGTNFQTTATASGLCAGMYFVTITDSLGNSLPLSIAVGEAQGTQLIGTTSTAESSADTCNGTATVTASGGSGTYTYIWDGNTGSQITQTATGLCPGTYSVTLVDSLGNEIIVFASVGVLPGILELNSENEAISVFPNPYRGETRISYVLTNESEVKVCVYNVLGELVTTLGDGVQSAGEHAFYFNSSELSGSGGMYIVRVNISGRIYSRRIVEVQ